MVSTLTVMSGAVIAPALPGIAQNLETTTLLSKLVLTLPALIIAVAAPFIGAISDRFGRIRVLLICMGIYGFFGTVAYWLSDIYLVLASRALFGIGVAGIITICISLVADYFQGDERNRFMGLQAGFMAFGGVVFLSISGVLADIHWANPFLLYLAGFLLLPLAAIFLHQPAKEERNPHELPASGKMINKIIIIYVVGFLGMMYFYIIPTQIPFLLRDDLQVSNTHTGIAISAATLLAAVSSMLYARVRSILNYSQIYGLSFILFAIGFLLVYLIHSYAGILIGLSVSGYGAGLLFPNGSLWLAEITPSNIRGRVNGGFSSSVFIGQFFSPILVAPLLRNFDLWDTLLIAALIIGINGIIMFILNKKLVGKP